MTNPEQGDLLAQLANLPDSAVERIMAEIAEQDRDLRFNFEVFHRENPGVYVALVALARQAKAKGHNRLGISMLWEVLRWQTLVGDVRAIDGYKLNNNHRAFYARLIMAQESDLTEFFETRRQTAA